MPTEVRAEVTIRSSRPKASHSRPDLVTLSSSAPSLSPFAMPEACFDYFATQPHYRSLASRIITALGGFDIVVVTGDRLSSAPALSAALSEAAAGRYTVTGFPREPGLGREDVLRLRRALSPSLAVGDAAGEKSRPTALIVIDDADRLSDEEIEEVFKHIYHCARIGDQRIGTALFLAGTKFLTRLEQPVLRFWLAKRLFVARLRFHELGTDEIAAFIHYQLPSGETQTIFTDEAIAAIANVSGGDPAVVYRFSCRMLDSVAANADDTLVKANVGSAIMVRPDMVPEERGVTPFREGPRQNRTVAEFATQLSTRKWRDIGMTLKLCAGVVLCLACVGMVAAVVHRQYLDEDIGGAPTKYTSAKVPQGGSLKIWAALPETSVAPAAVSPPEEPTAVLGKDAPTLATVPAAPTPENTLAISVPALSQSFAALRTNAEVVAPEHAGETVQTKMIPSFPPTGAAASSPTGTPPMKLTSSTADPPPVRLRLPAAEIATLLERADRLFALGDIASARLFYERAADAGEGRAALRLGNTFDPVFLDFAHLRVRGDAAMAQSWYSRARKLGEAEAEILPEHPESVSSR
jgi:hypothetical protein